MVGLSVEFYVYEDELWCRYSDGNTFLVDETQVELVSYVLNNVRARYPDAYKALEEHYKKSAVNVRYYQYLMVRRFCKCNFATLDSTMRDVESISRDGVFHFEKISCPLRGGDCPYENKICMPKFDSELSKAENRVMTLLYNGLTKDEIGEALYISPGTVKNHIKNAYLKLGVHSEAEFVKYATDHNIFKESIKE